MQILESKGDIGVFFHPKSQVTAPKKFHFSTDVRLGPPSVADLFDKVFTNSHMVFGKVFILLKLVFPILQLSLHSECSSSSNRHDVPRRTIPNPFNLQTEVREMWLFFEFLIMFAQQNNYPSLVAGKRSFKREAARSTSLTKEDGGGKGQGSQS
jgi:hypothetical protein